MTADYRVSLLIPCFNGERYVSRAFESILTQTAESLEVIFVDDGSSDNSGKIAGGYVDKFKSKGYRLLLLHKNNGGAASAIKLALQHARGRYVMLMDIDDELLPSSVEKQADYLDANADCDLVFTNGFRSLENTKERSLIRKSKEIIDKSHVFDGLVSGAVNNVPGVYMVRNNKLQEYYKEHDFLITNYGQNLQILLPVARTSLAGYIDDPLMIYNIHIGSHSNPDVYEKKISNLEGYKKIRLDILADMGCLTADIKKRVYLGYITERLRIDSCFGQRKQYNIHFKELRKYRNPSFQERLEFYVLNRSYKQYLYRLLLKFRNCIRR